MTDLYTNFLGCGETPQTLETPVDTRSTMILCSKDVQQLLNAELWHSSNETSFRNCVSFVIFHLWGLLERRFICFYALCCISTSVHMRDSWTSGTVDKEWTSTVGVGWKALSDSTLMWYVWQQLALCVVHCQSLKFAYFAFEPFE